MAQQPGDTLVLFLILGAILYLIATQFIPRFRGNPPSEPKEEFRGEVPDLLRENGYEVIGGKERIPLSIEMDDKEYESRLYIDYIARQDEECYIVIVARQRKPLRLSGAGLRDFFLAYYLLCQPDGLLYVDREKRTVKRIFFDVPELPFHAKRSRAGLAVYGGIGLGALLLWLILF
ncbi:hypothetical protein EDC32_101870 [Laceyella sacchari]|jgi:hypothetical protein|uniref:hypothetical protein n=1 Tax=Laceyella sacchari TaxID=37482 RepID=UPI0010487A3A|nr:hypothetical protein [Laceyella sacchari]TCW41209.1 hypothetical protein EDC32_101870 [Laceyella sacchari]